MRVLLLAAVLSLATAFASAARQRAGSPGFYDLCDPSLAAAVGLPCTHHPVQTADGFVIDMIRFANPGGYPVFLQHGLEDSAITWYQSAHPHQNLANLLYMQGYDVFLGNSRGNHYSRENVDHPDQSSAEYFDLIDWQKMPLDVAACINRIKNITGRATLAYVGHSQGTTQFFAGVSRLSEPVSQQMWAAHEAVRAQIVGSLDVAVLLAPVARVSGVTSLVFKLLASLDFDKWLALFGEKWFLEGQGLDWIVRQVAKVVCPIFGGTLCDDALILVCGQDASGDINATNLGVRTLKADPGGTSVKNMRHWASAVRRGDFAMFDYGSAGANQAHYGQATAPVYNLSSVASVGIPLVLAVGDNDALADSTDLAWLVPQLGSAVRAFYKVPNWGHLDVVWAVNAHTLLYPQVLSQIAKYKRN